MTVLVTGVTGFIGQTVVTELAKAGFDIRGASRSPEDVKSHWETAKLPAPDAPEEAFRILLKGITHVIHCAALNSDSSSMPQSAFHSANAILTGRLAAAASEMIPGRFIYLSSIRAVVDAPADAIVDPYSEARATNSYGRSKRDGEIRMQEAFSGRSESAAAIRLPPVYGRGMKGNLAALLKLADTPLPLPLNGIAGRRSLISRESVAKAVVHLVTMPLPLHPIYVASDAATVTLAEIVAAYRYGLGRPRRLFAISSPLLAQFASMIRKQDMLRSLAATQICDPSLLVASGWRQETQTCENLGEVARETRLHGVTAAGAS